MIKDSDSIEYLKARYPDFYKILDHRRYDSVPPEYTDPGKFLRFLGVIACHMNDVFLSSGQAPENGTMCSLVSNLHASKQYGFPRYLVGADLLDEIKQMTLPSDMTFEQVSWPFDGLAFLLPKGGLTHKNEGSVVGINVCIKQPGDGATLPGLNVTSLNHEKHASIMSHVLMESGHEYWTVMPVNKPLDTLQQYCTDMDPDDAKFGELCFGLAIQLVMVMEDEPGVLEKRALKKRTKLKDANGRHIEYWTPNWIGRNYKPLTEGEQGGTHASPRAHWRRGHWRFQAWGTGRKERKRIRIRPVKIMALKGLL